MDLQFELSTQQAKDFAMGILLKDIRDCISNNQEEYNQFLKEEQSQQSKNSKKYKFFYGSIPFQSIIKVGAISYEYFCTN